MEHGCRLRMATVLPQPFPVRREESGSWPRPPIVAVLDSGPVVALGDLCIFGEHGSSVEEMDAEQGGRSAGGDSLELWEEGSGILDVPGPGRGLGQEAEPGEPFALVEGRAGRFEGARSWR